MRAAATVEKTVRALLEAGTLVLPEPRGGCTAPGRSGSGCSARMPTPTVPPTWAADHLHHGAAGAYAVADLDDLDDETALVATARARYHRILNRSLRCGALGHVYAANLGVRADPYRRCGGFPAYGPVRNTASGGPWPPPVTGWAARRPPSGHQCPHPGPRRWWPRRPVPLAAPPRRLMPTDSARGPPSGLGSVETGYVMAHEASVESEPMSILTRYWALDDGSNSGRRGEGSLRRADRNFAELLQELRVAQTGVQILFAFLLGLAFAPRAELGEFERGVYVATLVLSAVTIALMIAPVAAHRLRFQHGLKIELVRVVHRCALAGLAALLLTMTGSLLLVLDVVLGRGIAVPVTGAVAGCFVGLWFVVPLALGRGTRADADEPAPGETTSPGAGPASE